MGKQAAPRKVGDKEALAVGTTIRGSARKLNLVAQLIRGRRVEEALNILKFSPKGMSEDVYKVLASAVANAENNHNLDVDALVVTEASTFATSGAMPLVENFKMLSASSTLRPRIRPATRLSFCAEPRIMVPTASASLSPTLRGDLGLDISAYPSCRQRGPGRSASAQIHQASFRPCPR